jgi:hypothetical protein
MYANGPTSIASRAVRHDRLHHGPSAYDGTFSPSNRDSPSPYGPEEVALERPEMPELSHSPGIRAHPNPAVAIEEVSGSIVGKC